MQTIHRLWLGPAPMPAAYVEYGHVWAEMNPGWKVMDWIGEGIKAPAGPAPENYRTTVLAPELLQNRAVWDQIGEAGAAAPVTMDPQVAIATQRADVASYELVHKWGGMYVNCDMEPLRPLHRMYLPMGCAWAAKEDDTWLSNAAFGGPAGHSFWATVIHALPYRFTDMRWQPMNQVTGPWLVTEVYNGWRKNAKRNGFFYAVERHIFNYANYVQVPPGGDASFYRGQALAADAIALHHWGHKGMMPGANPGRDTVAAG